MAAFQAVMQPLEALATKVKQSIWADTLMISAYIAAVSVALLIIQVLTMSSPMKKLYARVFRSEVPLTATEVSEQPSSRIPVGFFSETKAYMDEHGGIAVFAFKLAKLLCCLALLALSIVVFIIQDEGDFKTTPTYDVLKKWGKKKKKHARHEAFSRWEELQLAAIAVFTYASLLSLVSVAARRKWSRLAGGHLTLVLLGTFAVFVFRDIWPLCTYTKSPLDLHEGWFLWAQCIILTVAAAVIPLIAPRQYVPFDPAEPMKPHPEQVASVLSFVTWTFLDKVIYKAYKVPHLSLDMLPAVADYDRAKNLRKKAFVHLDVFSGGKPKYLFWGLMRVFWFEYAMMCLIVTVMAFASFASPFAIYGLLSSLESHGSGLDVRPWVFIILLFFGPFIYSAGFQLYIYFTTRSLVRTEAIFTQLIFEHALRVRMKADASGSTDASTAATSVSSTPADEPSEGHEDDGSGDETLRASTSSEATTATATSVKGKGKEEPKKDIPATSPATSGPSTDNLVGKINNLVSTDLSNITEARDLALVFLSTPLQVAVCIFFLYGLLGWSAFVGLASILLLFPVPGVTASIIQKVQSEKMKRTDARVQTVTETMNVIRMVKMFGWEPRMSGRLAEKREDELKFIWKGKILELINNNLNFVIPIITMIVTYATYTMIMKQDLTASKVFSSMAVFDMLRENMFMVFYMIPPIIQGKVSLDRIDAFLKKTELLDSFSNDMKADDIKTTILSGDVENTDADFGFNDAVFAWSNDADLSGTRTPSKRKFRLRVPGKLHFKRGGLNMIIGQTGSGKTSLLMAVLGELHFIPSGPSSWYNLPRSGGVAYAAQESWVLNETIRDNILFGSEYDEERYKKVIYQCALERDLTLFDAGDKTEVGERGMTLSGGQKARITLARAVYSSAEIVLLDDMLAALDVHTSKFIVEKCLSGDLLKGRTVLIVTHNVAMVAPIADFVVSLGADGRVSSQGSVSDALAKDSVLLQEAAEDQAVLEKAEEEVDPVEPVNKTKEGDSKDGKLIVAEEVEKGHVSLASFKLFTSALGGGHPLLFWVSFVGAMLVVNMAETFQTWFLGYWASQYEQLPSAEVPVPYYLSVYTVLLVSSILVYCSGYLIYTIGTMRASRSIHKQLVDSVLGTTLRWLDTTPASRIITRCTQDIRAVDNSVSRDFGALVEISITMAIKLAAVVAFTPIFLIPGIFIAAVGGYAGQIYMKAQLSVKREMSNARAPVLGHFGAAIAGLTSIRAYGAQKWYANESLRRIDSYTRAGRLFYNLNRWVSVRIDCLGSLFAAGLATYLVYGSKIKESNNIGFSINMAVGFSSMILWYVRILNNFEIEGNSLERINGYVNIEQEPKATKEGVPPASWPTSGDLRVEDLSARYSPDGPKVLHGISFHIKSGERVGVVGRTGSGKSSLTLSLLRCIFTDGTVYYDGVPTNSINLDILRSNVTIIPQTPELLSGTLRINLDPFGQFDDLTLNNSLRAAGLNSIQTEEDEDRITLDTPIASGGSNLSVGQRQVLALARAMVRGSKLLILDEATSAIDHTTDTAIQTSLRRELKGDVTLLTVAHRLQTIMDADKIMVLDAGKIVEFDTPSELLKNEKGLLYSLVNQSGDKDKLYAMTEGRSQ